MNTILRTAGGLRPWALAACLTLLSGCFRALFKDVPDPDWDRPPDTLEVRVTRWDPRLEGSAPIYNAFDTVPEDENPPTGRFHLDRDAGFDKSESGVQEADLRVLMSGSPDFCEGLRFRYRRGDWSSDRVLDEDENLGTVVVPAGTPVRSKAVHHFFGIGWARRLESGDLTVLMTSGMAATNVLFDMKFPQGHEESGIGAGLLWLEGEVEYRPSIFTLSGRLGGVSFPAGGSVEGEAKAGLRWEGMRLEVGYRQSRIVPESVDGRAVLSGFMWSVGFDF